LEILVLPTLARAMRASRSRWPVRQARHQQQQEAIMFHVLDHANVVYTGDLSQSTQYVIDHYGKKLDEAIHAGIKLLYSDALHSLPHAEAAVTGKSPADIWRPIEDWKID
jgi:hypothetical protein